MSLVSLHAKSWATVLMTFFIWGAHAQEERPGGELDFQMDVQLEDRYFLTSGAYEGQEDNYLSAAANPQFEYSWNDGDDAFKVSLFGRLDQHDQNRTHADVRELYYQKARGAWELSLGWKKVFWGVTESSHLVDVINQTDQVESFDGEQKLGQPMAHFSYLSAFGTFDLFYLPYARKRQFPARKGRLRFPVVIEREDIGIDAKAKEWYPSAAFRWSNYFGILDVGLSYFHGVGREPLFTGLGTASVDFFYPIMDQAGLDVQATTGPLLWKLEWINRFTRQQDFHALTAGVEYTFGNVGSTGLDIGLIAEYLYDSRDELAISNLANDVFSGFRLAFNDTQSTEFLAGSIIDLEKNTRLYSMEASRRVGSAWKLELEMRLFETVSPEEFLFNFRRDSFGRMVVIRYL